MGKLKYYAFDWDDNLLQMPTNLIGIDDAGNEVKISTQDYSLIRSQLNKGKLVQIPTTGQLISALAPDFLREFKNYSLFMDQALLAIKNGMFKSSWNDFVECLNNGSIFSIITARSTPPYILRSTIEYLVQNNVNGIDKNKVLNSLQYFAEKAGDDIKQELLLDDYLWGLAQIHPVSYGFPNGECLNLELEKVKALDDFVGFIKFHSKRQPGNLEIHIGFSDDDKKNVETMICAIIGKYKGINFHIYDTGNGKKTTVAKILSKR